MAGERAGGRSGGLCRVCDGAGSYGVTYPKCPACLGARVISVKRCDDFPDGPGCCASCHEDANEFGYTDAFYDEEMPDGTVVNVCCAVRNWLNEQHRG
jgi:hypothetical protein